MKNIADLESRKKSLQPQQEVFMGKHCSLVFSTNIMCLSVEQSVGQAAGLCGKSIPKGGFQGFSDCSLGWSLKAPKIFSEGKPEAVGRRFA